MTHSEKKAATRRKVLSEAAAAIRAVGPQGIGVAQLMARAGLTHGGFYAHFKSKDDLIAQAILGTFDDAYELFTRHTADRGAHAGLCNYIDNYLSARHRDHPERGCPLPALAGEVARLAPASRDNFSFGLKRLNEAVANLLLQLGRVNPEQHATSAIAEMVGAVALSRAISDADESLRILECARDSIKSRLGLAQVS